MNRELSTLTEMVNLLIESNEVLSHSDCDDELALAGRISRVIPSAAQIVIKTMTGQIRLVEAILEAAEGKRQVKPSDEDLEDLAEASGVRIEQTKGPGIGRAVTG